MALLSPPWCMCQGAVDVFVRSYTNPGKTEYIWVYSTSLAPASGQLSDRLGSSLSISNFTIVAGAPTRSLLINPRANVVCAGLGVLHACPLLPVSCSWSILILPSHLPPSSSCVPE